MGFNATEDMSRLAKAWWPGWLGSWKLTKPASIMDRVMPCVMSEHRCGGSGGRACMPCMPCRLPYGLHECMGDSGVMSMSVLELWLTKRGPSNLCVSFTGVVGMELDAVPSECPLQKDMVWGVDAERTEGRRSVEYPSLPMKLPSTSVSREEKESIESANGTMSCLIASIIMMMSFAVV